MFCFVFVIQASLKEKQETQNKCQIQATSTNSTVTVHLPNSGSLLTKLLFTANKSDRHLNLLEENWNHITDSHASANLLQVILGLSDEKISYEICFCFALHLTYNIMKAYKCTLCVCRYKNINICYKKYPTILLHGLCAIPHTQREMAEYLNNNPLYKGS